MQWWSSWFRTFCLWLAGFCIACAAAGVEASAQGELQTSVVILLDFSQSFAPLKSEDEQALNALADSLLQQARQEWETPVLVRWAVIGSSSLFADPPCGPAVQFAPKLLQGLGNPNGSTSISDVGVFQAWLRECIQQSVKKSQTTQKYTDISGALALAAETASAVKRKFIVVLSDFVEDREPGSAPLKIALKGEKVMMLYRPEAGDRQDPARLFNRLSGWEKTLVAVGASGVCRVPVVGAVSGSLIGCLR